MALPLNLRKDDLGQTLNQCVTPTANVRERLTMKALKPQKQKKRIKRTEDGAEVSVYSMATTVNNDPNAKQQTQDGIKVDYAYTANEQR